MILITNSQKFVYVNLTSAEASLHRIGTVISFICSEKDIPTLRKSYGVRRGSVVACDLGPSFGG